MAIVDYGRYLFWNSHKSGLFLARGPQFDSRHCQFLLSVNFIENNEKEAGNGKMIFNRDIFTFLCC